MNHWLSIRQSNTRAVYNLINNKIHIDFGETKQVKEVKFNKYNSFDLVIKIK